MARTRIMFFVLLATLIVGAAGNNTGPTTSLVRACHAVYDGPAVDIYANDKILLSNFAYFSVSSYATVGTGSGEFRAMSSVRGRKDPPERREGKKGPCSHGRASRFSYGRDYLRDGNLATGISYRPTMHTINGVALAFYSPSSSQTDSSFLPFPFPVNIKVTVAGTSTVLLSQSVSVPAGNALTLAVVGTVASKSVQLVVFQDDLSNPAPGTAHLRIFNLSPGSPNFGVDLISSAGRSAGVAIVPYPKASNTLSVAVPPSSYGILLIPTSAQPRQRPVLEVKAAGARDNVGSTSSLISTYLHEAILESCKLYDKFIFGPPSDLKMYAVVYAPAGGCSGGGGGGLPISNDGSCGAGVAICYSQGPCCSKYGYCGSGSDYVSLIVSFILTISIHAH